MMSTRLVNGTLLVAQDRQGTWIILSASGPIDLLLDGTCLEDNVEDMSQLDDPYGIYRLAVQARVDDGDNGMPDPSESSCEITIVGCEIRDTLDGAVSIG